MRLIAPKKEQKDKKEKKKRKIGSKEAKNNI